VPVFLSYNGLQRLCEHVWSAAEVELGGVLVGDQCHDEQGNPFVVMTDSLAAQDYKNSAGSFTFTHNAWSRFTRELDSLPGSRRMIGWYHSHPGWGVFLSDRDQFICESFFVGRLDIAMVVDPQSKELGVFQHTDSKSNWMQPAAGCFVFMEGEVSAEMMAEGLPNALRYYAGPRSSDR
jgi:proteasome lid subunit RPN8/RPN11